MSKVEKDKEVEVLIVGAGPTGLTLANTLMLHGISCRIIDKRSVLSALPRAINIGGPTLEIMKKFGILSKLLEQGLKIETLTLYWQGKRLSNFKTKYFKGEYPYIFHLEQSYLEKYLTSASNEVGIIIEKGIELESVQQEKNRVNVKLKKFDGSIEYKNYSYVVGCDGGQSRVRELLDIPSQHKDYGVYFVLADVKLKRGLNVGLHYFLTPEGYFILAPLSETRCRLIASFNGNYPGQESLKINKEYLENLFKKRSNNSIEIAEISWSASAPFYHRLAHKAKSGRVFLAGDALHQFSPVGGTNMNTGIQDAFDLAERLADSIKNKAASDALGFYESTRLSVAQKILKITENATHLITQDLKIPELEKKFLPQMCNRKFIREKFPALFSGYAFSNECTDVVNF